MKKNIVSKSLLIISLFIVAFGCSDDNNNPICTITYPTDGLEIIKGQVVTLIANATDDDGVIEEVQFFVDEIGIGSSSDFPYSYEWSTANVSSGSHILKAIGKDNSGGSSSDEVSITIIEGGVPDAVFSANITYGMMPLTVVFTDESINNPVSWLWDFGDGNSSTEQNPINNYSSLGTYTVILTVINSYGTDTETKVDYITVSNGMPVADFIADKTNIFEGETVIFTDQSLDSPNSWLWDFGDGGTSTDQNP